MTEPTRGTRARRGNRRPGSLLLTTLLVLAIVASSVLVFTNRVELLKLAVVVALWAAVVAAFVSFIYRRQADVDQAKSRDLKLVYDLQLDREISARREYELSLEAHLRRELASELRTETSDEVASLRAELAALRAHLEIIFDTDLQNRPAIETERTAVHPPLDWAGVPQAVAPPERTDRGAGPGRVISSRIDTEAQEDFEPNTEESPIIDVPAEPQPSDEELAAQMLGGAHRRPSEPEPVDNGWRAPPQEPTPPPEGRRRAPEPVPTPEPTPAPQPAPTPEVWPEPEPQRPAARLIPTVTEWRPAPAEGQYVPAGAPGSNWAQPPSAEPVAPPPPVQPAMSPPPTEAPRPGRHYTFETSASEAARRARHSAGADPGRPTPTLAAPAPPPASQPPEVAEPQTGATGNTTGASEATGNTGATGNTSARHRGADEVEESEGQHIGGQPVSELMARLQAGSTGGGRRRRREE